jgi:hypothetical protein
LQPLDLSIFKPFEIAFWSCRDASFMQNKGRSATKKS